MEQTLTLQRLIRVATMIALSALRICLALALFAPFAATVPTPSTISTLSNAPTPSFVASGPAGTLVVPFASDDPNQPLWSQDTDIDPEPIRGNLGAPIVAPQNVKLDQMNPDLFAPPSTDAGTMYADRTYQSHVSLTLSSSA